MNKEIISKAAKFIDEKKYDEFQKMNFGNDDMASITDNVWTLDGIEYLDKKGLIPEEYFSKKEVIFNSSPEQVDFYISKGARVNDSQKFWNYEDDCEEEVTFLDLTIEDSRYSAENVKSVIDAGGKFAYGVVDVDSLFDKYGMMRDDTVAKIKVLNEAGLIDQNDKKILIDRLPISNADVIAKLANPNSEGTDYLQMKADILREKIAEQRFRMKGSPIGKTGDSQNVEINGKHRVTAWRQSVLMSALMKEKNEQQK